MLLVKELVHVGLCGILSRAQSPLNVAQLILLLFELLNLHLVDILTDLLSQKVPQLVSYLVL